MVEVGGGERVEIGKEEGIGEKKREWGKKKGNRKKSATVLEHKQFTMLFTLNCSTVTLMSQASFRGTKASFQSWWSHKGGMSIAQDEILWSAKPLGDSGFLF